MANQVFYAKYFTETMAVDTVDLAKLRAVVGSVNESSVVSGDLTGAINYFIDGGKETGLQISGNVAGLEIGRQITLLNNGLNSVTIMANGQFSIDGANSSGKSYSITVGVNPENQICNVINGTGIIGPSAQMVKVVCEYNHVFSIKSVELPDLKAYFSDLCGNAETGHNVQNVVPVDLNRDGLMDLVINIWCSPRPSGGDYNGPTPSRILAFIQDASGSFSDRTAETFGVLKVDIGGVGEYVVTNDFNGDGWRDIVFSLNREDGRTVNSPADAQWTRNVAMMSTGAGRYSAVPFGLPAWNASMFLKDNASGGQDLITTNFSLGPQSWTYTNGWTALAGYDWVSSSVFFFRGSSSRSASTRALLSTYSPQVGVQPWALVDGAWKGGVGQYLDTSTIQKLCCGNAAPSGATMVSVDGKDYVDAGYGFSCEFRKTPSSPPIALVHFNGQEIVGGYKGQTVVYGQTPLIGTDRLLAFSLSVDGNSVSRVSMNVVNEVQQSLEANLMKCGDINGDGFDDVYFMRSKRDLMPVVYLNDGGGNLKLIDANVFPKSPDGSGLTNFMLADMDGDGVQDLVYFPIYTPSGTYSDLRIRIHKGLRAMRQRDAKK